MCYRFPVNFCWNHYIWVCAGIVIVMPPCSFPSYWKSDTGLAFSLASLSAVPGLFVQPINISKNKVTENKIPFQSNISPLQFYFVKNILKNISCQARKNFFFSHFYLFRTHPVPFHYENDGTAEGNGTYG